MFGRLNLIPGLCVQVDFLVDNDLSVVYKETHQLRTVHGAVTCRSLKGAAVK